MTIDLSPIDASLVTAIASFASDSAAGVFALEALLWLVEGVKEGWSQGWVASKRLGDAAVRALCAPAVVDAMVHHLSLGYGSAWATIIEVLSEVTPDARAFATPRVVGALLEVISLDGAAALEAYALRKNDGRLTSVRPQPCRLRSPGKLGGRRSLRAGAVRLGRPGLPLAGARRHGRRPARSKAPRELGRPDAG